MFLLVFIEALTSSSSSPSRNPPPRKSSTDMPLNLKTYKLEYTASGNYAPCIGCLHVLVAVILFFYISRLLLLLALPATFATLNLSLDVLMLSSLLNGLFQLSTGRKLPRCFCGLFTHTSDASRSGLSGSVIVRRREVQFELVDEAPNTDRALLKIYASR